MDGFFGAIGALGVSMDKRLCIMCLRYTFTSVCFHRCAQSPCHRSTVLNRRRSGGLLPFSIFSLFLLLGSDLSQNLRVPPLTHVRMTLYPIPQRRLPQRLRIPPERNVNSTSSSLPPFLSTTFLLISLISSGTLPTPPPPSKSFNSSNSASRLTP